jgi:hypothetical protein
MRIELTTEAIATAIKLNLPNPVTSSTVIPSPTYTIIQPRIVCDCSMLNNSSQRQLNKISSR